jgi:hypothetical protein
MKIYRVFEGCLRVFPVDKREVRSMEMPRLRKAVRLTIHSTSQRCGGPYLLESFNHQRPFSGQDTTSWNFALHL